ncbi:hypothetical protein [Zunongwangia sp.]|uniref:hypothetical protein n=1 Tax=Zunongwangia sp. TaxID=1965325 RepID=UPI003AA9A5BB
MRITKNIFYLVVIFQFLNCTNGKNHDKGSNDEKSNYEISGKIRLAMLDEILKDNVQIIRNKKALIVHHKLMPEIEHFSGSGENLEKIAYLDYLSNTLKENDTSFIKYQIDQLKAFSLEDLETDGYNIFDFKHYVNKDIEIDSIYQIVELSNYENGIDNQALQFLYGPIMNKKKNKVYLKIDTPYSGNTYLFEKKDGVWSKKNIGNWVE